MTRVSNLEETKIIHEFEYREERRKWWRLEGIACPAPIMIHYVVACTCFCCGRDCCVLVRSAKVKGLDAPMWVEQQ